MENHFVILTMILIAALVLAVAGISAAGLFKTESYKVYASDTNDQSNVFQGENQFNNQTTNSTFSIK